MEIFGKKQTVIRILTKRVIDNRCFSFRFKFSIDSSFQSTIEEQQILSSFPSVRISRASLFDLEAATFSSPFHPIILQRGYFASPRWKERILRRDTRYARKILSSHCHFGNYGKIFGNGEWKLDATWRRKSEKEKGKTRRDIVGRPSLRSPISSDEIKFEKLKKKKKKRACVRSFSLSFRFPTMEKSRK